MTYNGWSNWETWNVNLWIDNEEDTYFDKEEFINNTPIDIETVEGFCRNRFPNGTQDMDDASEMDKVNWSELCESWKEEKMAIPEVRPFFKSRK
tara:strand:+ start:1612 stop:1893 length:282 start_codon:yes stop_codon:yes gene_type:complete